ncbi:SDR family NAD(P)-dependent oxidoreductase [Fibrella aquatilis]|uniref:SDR family NAD(P)-dependent oxidoreductase n=1 Tax=Fibrella aquatilis TaxID=2817059 RepID=A0A939G3Y4_9BACT|nr:SDR family NAD(P)-dependent oxidoreductase [Fibrella aquatilis]MBO0931917.1 SDR family NAD(P)-dependent oxidoreductase [Fibrella aquatilis]
MKTILITGATEGVGKATALALAQQGHRLILHGRNADKLNTVISELKATTSNARLEPIVADFSSLEAVTAMAQTLLDTYDRLDVLINNAGAMFSHRQVSQDGFEQMVTINYLAPYLLTEKLLPLLRATPNSRIVNVSSVGYKSAKPNFDDFMAEQHYNMQRDYFNSKLYGLYHTLDLAEQLKTDGITVNAVHPGGVQTQLARDFKGGMKFLFNLMMPLFFVSPEKGAETSVYVATNDEVAGLTGQYFVKKKPEKLLPIGTDSANRARLRTLTWQYLAPYL